MIFKIYKDRIVIGNFSIEKIFGNTLFMYNEKLSRAVIINSNGLLHCDIICYYNSEIRSATKVNIISAIVKAINWLT
jgi:hypothetical protein